MVFGFDRGVPSDARQEWNEKGDDSIEQSSRLVAEDVLPSKLVVNDEVVEVERRKNDGYYKGGDRKIDKQEFYWGLQDLGAAVSKNEAALLLEYLDTNQDGVVSFDEFLVGIRGMPNEVR